MPSGFSKLISKHLQIKSRECKFNPDWDEDVILKLFDLIGNTLNWTPPILPNISKIIPGIHEPKGGCLAQPSGQPSLHAIASMTSKGKL